MKKGQENRRKYAITDINGVILVLIVFLVVMIAGFFGFGSYNVDASGQLVTTKESQEAGVLLASFILSSLTLLLFFVFRPDPQTKSQTQLQISAAICLILLNGTLMRLCLAYVFYGNFDMESWEIAADIAARDGNPYLELEYYRYNLSPLWMHCLEILKYLQVRVSFLEFHFVVRSFLTMVDILTLIFLLLIARRQSLPLVRTAMLFYLNPVSFLLTGYHGQIENLAILMVVMGIYLYLALDPSTGVAKIILWALSTLGLMIKHNICYVLVVSLDTGFKSYIMKLSFFALSCGLFALSFIGYWEHGNHEIIKNVFMYSSFPRPYGIRYLSGWSGLKYLFIIGLILFPLALRHVDLIKKFLLTSLFFLVFTTGSAIQYFVIPIAFAALRPSRGLTLYSVAATAFILCSQENLHVFPPFEMPWNIVWLGAVFWFVDDLRGVLPILSKERSA